MITHAHKSTTKMCLLVYYLASIQPWNCFSSGVELMMSFINWSAVDFTAMSIAFSSLAARSSKQEGTEFECGLWITWEQENRKAGNISDFSAKSDLVLKMMKIELWQSENVHPFIHAGFWQHCVGWKFSILGAHVIPEHNMQHYIIKKFEYAASIYASFFHFTQLSCTTAVTFVSVVSI